MKDLFYAELLEAIEPVGNDVIISDAALFLVTDDISKYPTHLEFYPVVGEAFEAYSEELKPLL